MATVSSSYDAANGLTASVRALASGETVITATSADGLSDSVEVTVLPEHQPEFNLSLEEGGSQLTLAWDLIPGATEYQVMLEHGDAAELIDTVTGDSCTIDQSRLYADVDSKLYVCARRVVGGQATAVYTSEKLIRLSFGFVLPSSIQTISQDAFAGDAAIQSVYIPDGAKAIASGSFRGCTSLTAVRIPDSVDSIIADAFSGSALSYVQTPENSFAAGWFARNMTDVTIVYE